ncbi:MAG: hypothetical protein ACYC42_01710 [Lysobacter sp.]
MRPRELRWDDVLGDRHRWWPLLDVALADVPLPPRSAAVRDAQRRQADGAAALSAADLRSVSAIAMVAALAMPGLAAQERRAPRAHHHRPSASARLNPAGVPVIAAFAPPV